MSVPLRKEEPEEELTTADIAQSKRPVASEVRPFDPLEHQTEDRHIEDPTIEDRRGDDRPVGDPPGDDLAVEEPPAEDDSGEEQLRDWRRPVLAPRAKGESVQNAALDGKAKASDVQNASGTAPLFPNHELEELRGRWNTVQTDFVDEPRRAVEQADGLVAAAMKRLAEVFAEERSKLEQQWDRGDNVSTEDLRIALQRYRSFFQRLLAV
jgi:hypothetical protein